ncbi:MAG: hypothetical protein ACFCVC_05090 [Acidimicrobiia bacterium]
MTNRPALPPSALNHMRRGLAYAVTTVTGDRATGEYAGIEVSHDEWALILLEPGSPRSIPIGTVAVVDPLG